mmetsp:Transcript_73933/g.197016  ORF Transcript_73933/g.197016 Transcript_73933/m.197016 type:complete len:95 (+) Transcript_73933:1198-1482(+)
MCGGVVEQGVGVVLKVNRGSFVYLDVDRELCLFLGAVLLAPPALGPFRPFLLGSLPTPSLPYVFCLLPHSLPREQGQDGEHPVAWRGYRTLEEK